jgi:hypothetical protein
MNKTAALDIAERTVATYLETFLGLLLASTTVLDLGVLKAAAIAAVPAALAVVKGGLAALLGPTGDASLLPTRKKPE